MSIGSARHFSLQLSRWLHQHVTFSKLSADSTPFKIHHVFLIEPSWDLPQWLCGCSPISQRSRWALPILFSIEEKGSNAGSLSLTDLITSQLHQPLRLDQNAVRPCCGLQPPQDDHSWLKPKVIEDLPVSFQTGEVGKRYSEVSITACWTTGMVVCLCVHVWDSAVCSLQTQSWWCWIRLCEAIDVPADPPATASWTELLLNQKVLNSSCSSWLKEQQTTVLRFAVFSWQHDVIRLCSDWPTRQSNMESVRKLQIYGCSRVNINNNKQSDIRVLKT